METVHLLRLLILFNGISPLQQVKSWIINVPTKITAVEGSCVVVPCQTQPHSQVNWYQYHTLHYPVVYDKLHPDKIEEQFRGRTSVQGNAADGNCTLMIDNVRGDDNNLQVYVWIYPALKEQRFYDQTVTIFVERHAPIISIQKKIVDGEFFQANCSIRHSCPFKPPPLHWNVAIKEGFSRNETFSQKVQGQWLYTEMLHGWATYEMHNSIMTCSAQFATFTTESEQITLSILYKPVTVTLTPEKETVTEGGSIIMECTADCNPQPYMYSWLKRQMGQINDMNSTQRKMFFSNITQDTSFSCIAHNDIGMGQSDWLDLNVQHVPVILPESSCHLTGEVLRCVCRAKASPNAFINWTIDGNNSLPSSFRLVSTNDTNVVSEEISGPAKVQTIVSCTAWNSLGKDTKELHKGNLSSSLSISLSISMILGSLLLFGFAFVFIYRKYRRNRWQDEDIQSSPCGSERNPEVDRLSCVYDNVEEMRRPTRAQQHKNNETALQRRGGIQPLAKGVDCDMDIYLNC